MLDTQKDPSYIDLDLSLKNRSHLKHLSHKKTFISDLKSSILIIPFSRSNILVNPGLKSSL